VTDRFQRFFKGRDWRFLGAVGALGFIVLLIVLMVHVG